MATRTRISTFLRRAAITAALGALLAPAAAGAATAEASKAKKAKAPVITRVAPLNLAVGETLTINGRNFVRGRLKNSVVFKRDGGKAVFVKADVGTAKLLKVQVPPKLTSSLSTKAGAPIPTRFRLRVLARKLSKRYTSRSRSPVIGPAKPPGSASPPASAADGDCDGDGVLNGSEGDDDGDLLSDATEAALKTDSCNADSDGDGVTDGYEYQSAVDLNDDEYRNPQNVVPAPEKRPYPNPLFADATVDYDGDSLTLGEEYLLWLAYRDHDGMDPLIYSDGNQYSVYDRAADGHRPGNPRHDPFAKQVDFINWAQDPNHSYINVYIRGSVYDLRDANQDGTVSATASGNYRRSEQHYYDFDNNGKLSDDERDEDADGLTNYDEAHGRMTSGYWKGCYDQEQPYPIVYAGTNITDPDTDGDGVRDGADDQEHDDIPNLMELSRNAASGRVGATRSCDEATDPVDPNPAMGFVNPYNPCLPYVDSRTCARHPSLTDLFAPFDPATPIYQVLN